MLNIRPAVPADAETLVCLNTAFNEVGDVTPEDVRRSLLNSSEVVVVAEINGETAAFCCAQVHHSFCYKAPVAEVMEMYVDEAYRRQGCASGMDSHHAVALTVFAFSLHFHSEYAMLC